MRSIFRKQFPILGLYLIVSCGDAFGYLCDDYFMSRVSGWPEGLSICILTLFPAIIFHWYYKDEFNGFFGLEGSLKGILFLAGPILHICIGVLGYTQNVPSWNTAFLIFSQALNEEIAFRGIVCSYCMKQIRKPEHIPIFTVVAGLSFGFMHLFNFLDGTPILSVLDQVIITSLFGIVLSAVFLRCGTIWPGVIVHTFWNLGTEMRTMTYTMKSARIEVMSGFDEIVSAGRELASSDFALNIIVILVCLTLYLLPTYLLTRPGVRDDVFSFWQRKWSKDLSK